MSLLKVLCIGIAMSLPGVAYEPLYVDVMDGAQSTGKIATETTYRGTLIAISGDIRSILGPQGKSIAVSANGEAIAVIYGDPTGDPSNYMEVMIAYSIDFGATWTTYGPLSGFLRRIYPGVDGSPNFDTNPGELYFVWQESTMGYTTGAIRVLIEENVPAAPSFSSPVILPHSDSLCYWFPSIAVSPDDPYRVIVTAWSYLNYGNLGVYCWVGTDCGYIWSDTILMIDSIDANGAPGHIRWGSGDYIFYTYQDLYDWHGTPVIYPYYVESTDGGWTWSQPAAMPEVPLLDPLNAQFWWHEMDCEVINDEPWVVHNDINQYPDSGGFWIFHAEGSPGDWSWEIFNIDELGACSTYFRDTLFYCSPRQYPSVAYDPVSNTLLVAYLADFLKMYGTDTLYAGPHIGGIYSVDNGSTWTVSAPLSETHGAGGSWVNWNGTEVAHRLVNINGTVYSIAVWIMDVTFNTYFEKGIVRPFVPLGIDEHSNSVVCAHLHTAPTISRDKCAIRFSLSAPTIVVIDLYDATGRFMKKVFDGICAADMHELDIGLSDIPPGIYFVRLQAGEHTDMTKIIVAR
ncbi:MAG: T9SS type A sorting domain-containing protein [candidate division WOR-3 bacterium]|nr:MAG: T9SS type A sorting domain-containing protein [candidate division WOR-3 bacterium]